jgi:hypothetical protein
MKIRNTVEKMNRNKSWLFKKKNKTNNFWIRQEKDTENINKITIEREDIYIAII